MLKKRLLTVIMASVVALPLAAAAHSAAYKTKITYLVSTSNATKYCNGANMDSAGYAKTITKKVTRTIHSPQKLSDNDRIRGAVLLASRATNMMTVLKAEPNIIKIKGDTAYVGAIDGWAGVSIFMCAWKPLVEANLLSFPQIKKVVWQSQD